MIAASKQEQKKNTVHYKFSVPIPCNCEESLCFDKANGNILWQAAINCECNEVQAHNTYHSIGLGTLILEEYTKIPVNFVFKNCKEDGRHKGQIMANGNKTPLPVDPVYSSVTTLCSLQIYLLVIFPMPIFNPTLRRRLHLLLEKSLDLN